MSVRIKNRMTKRFPSCLLPVKTDDKSLIEIGFNIKPVHLSVKIRRPAK
jgi:hypothetical protein